MNTSCCNSSLYIHPKTGAEKCSECDMVYSLAPEDWTPQTSVDWWMLEVVCEKLGSRIYEKNGHAVLRDKKYPLSAEGYLSILYDAVQHHLEKSMTDLYIEDQTFVLKVSQTELAKWMASQHAEASQLEFSEDVTLVEDYLVNGFIGFKNMSVDEMAEEMNIEDALEDGIIRRQEGIEKPVNVSQVTLHQMIKDAYNNHGYTLAYHVQTQDERSALEDATGKVFNPHESIVFLEFESRDKANEFKREFWNTIFCLRPIVEVYGED